MTEVLATPKDILALMVWEHLEREGERGRSVWELQKYDLPELTKHQIKRGLDHINHVLQETQEQPMVYFHERGRGPVWRLPVNALDYQTFAMHRMRGLMTRTHTELTRAEAAVLRWPEDMAPYLPKMLHRVIEDIEDIVAELGDDR